MKVNLFENFLDNLFKKWKAEIIYTINNFLNLLIKWKIREKMLLWKFISRNIQQCIENDSPFGGQKDIWIDEF